MVNLPIPCRRKFGLLTVASAAFIVSFVSSRPACAEAPASAPAPATVTAAVPTPNTALKLFRDSRMITRDRISVEVVGSGSDVVMIPGLASSREVWRRTAERLRGRYRLHLVQVAGFAGEPARANASGPVVGPVAADIDAYLASLPRPPIVMGHSLGGAIGLALAERHPEHISKLLIVDSLPFYGVLMGGPTATADTVRPMAQTIQAQMAGGMPEGLARTMMSQMVTAPADVDRVVGWTLASEPSVVGVAMAEDMTLDLRPGLPAVKIPTSVIYEAPLRAMIEVGYARLGPKTLVEVQGSKHFIMYDQPARFDAEVDAFLSR